MTALTTSIGSLRHRFPLIAAIAAASPRGCYLDSAATTQKPDSVLAAIDDYYRHANANVHRGAHRLATVATERFEQARDRVRAFVGAAAREEIIWTRGTTEAINLVAHGLAERLAPGDEILLTAMEHHANIVPWQLVAARRGARIRFVPVLANGELDLDALPGLLGARTRIFAFTHASNVLGTINPVARLCALARQHGAVSVVDGAQAVAHGHVDVQSLGADFYAFSGHKMYAPTGIGVLYGRREVLETLPPWQGGGEMIEQVTFEKTTFNALPYRLEAGTPHIEGAIGLGAAVDFLDAIDPQALGHHEDRLRQRAEQALAQVDGLRIIGTAAHKVPVVSFVVDGVHAADVGTLLDQQGIAVRTGHHCAMPLLSVLGVEGTVRASLALYNDNADVDALVAGVRLACSFFRT